MECQVNLGEVTIGMQTDHTNLGTTLKEIAWLVNLVNLEGRLEVGVEEEAVVISGEIDLPGFELKPRTVREAVPSEVMAMLLLL